MSGALAGIKVLDRAGKFSGSYCAMLLGDFGAEVIRVEHEGAAAGSRGEASQNVTIGDPVTRSRSAIALDFETSAGREILRDLIQRADVLIEDSSSQAGGDAQWGYHTTSSLNPRLVHCSVTPFGKAGPAAGSPGNELIIEARSGILSATGILGMPPAAAGANVVETATGIFSALAILAALNARKTSGVGQYVDMALLDVAVGLSTLEATTYLLGGPLPVPLGSTNRRRSPHGSFRTLDGDIVLSADGDKNWKSFCEILGFPELISDSRFLTNDDRVLNRKQLQEIAEARLQHNNRLFWLKQLEKAGIPSGPVNTLEDVFNDPQCRHRQMCQTLAGEPAVGVNVKLSGTPGKSFPPPQTPNQDAESILLKIGYPREKIDAFVDALEHGPSRSRSKVV